MLTEKRSHSDGIALTKSLPIAVRRPYRAGLALSVSHSLASSPKGGALRTGSIVQNKSGEKTFLAAKSASCLTRTGDTLINSQVL